MKKRMAWTLVLTSILGLMSCSGAGTKPYQDLDGLEISSATVWLQPPDKTLEIKDMDRLADLLRDVVLYQQDNSYTEYGGQGVTFQLNMADGTQTSIMAYNPFLVVDGVGYRTEYESCEALSRFANELLNAEDTVVVLEEPPVLTVVSDEMAAVALVGTYTWQKKLPDGTFSGTACDSPHPLDCKDLLSPPLETAQATAELRFAQQPDEILNIQCWRDTYWSDPSADGEDVVWSGNRVELKPGGNIYEVVARWDTAGGYGGTACYSFYIVMK